MIEPERQMQLILKWNLLWAWLAIQWAALLICAVALLASAWKWLLANRPKKP